MSKAFITTADGSVTCSEPSLGELYHNRAGAYTEALINYVGPCNLNKYLQHRNRITALDSCFGLGYNTFVLIEKLLATLEVLGHQNTFQSCVITAIDTDREIIKLLPEILYQPQFRSLCAIFSPQAMTRALLESGCFTFFPFNDSECSISVQIQFIDLRKALADLDSKVEKFTYIFHDGFSPKTMPELWTLDLFQQYRKHLSNDGRLITYSSAYAVRGALQKCGFKIRRTVALGQKSGGTIAFTQADEIVDDEYVFFLSEQENSKLNTSSATPYRDPDFKLTRKQIVQNRQLEIANLYHSRF